MSKIAGPVLCLSTCTHIIADFCSFLTGNPSCCVMTLARDNSQTDPRDNHFNVSCFQFPFFCSRNAKKQVIREVVIIGRRQDGQEEKDKDDVHCLPAGRAGTSVSARSVPGCIRQGRPGAQAKPQRVQGPGTVFTALLWNHETSTQRWLQGGKEFPSRHWPGRGPANLPW